MQLKLSNFVVIIAIIFFLYYYFIHVPKTDIQELEELEVRPVVDNGVTQLLPPQSYEGFSVTPIESIIPETDNFVDTIEITDMAGNVRPDNVMFAGNEPATHF